MATNIDVTLKRYNGTDYDQILPTTHLGQIFTDNTLTTTLSDYLGNTYIPLTQKGAANGVATLDSNQKLTFSQLPDVAFDSLTYSSALDLSNNPAQEIVNGLNTAFSTAALVNRSARGFYFVFSAGGALNALTTATVADPGPNERWFTYDFQPGDGAEGSNGDGGTAEAGDWVIIEAITGTGTQADPYYVRLAVVNNAYESATTTAQGIVQLTDMTSLASASGNDVVTEGILGALVETDEADMSGTDGAFTGIGANLIAPARHKHDSRYYTETEINNWILGTQTISSNTYVPIIYGSDPTSNITGAILIDID